jgi:glutaredoxin
MADVTIAVELFGTSGCPYTAEMREHLLWSGVEFAEYDVETDPSARARLMTLVGDHAAVPVLVRDGRVAEIGWRGRSCALGRPDLR